MLQPIEISRALLETVRDMSDGNPDLEDFDVDFGDPTTLPPPDASVASQLTMSVTVDGVDYAVVAYQVAG